tara:strand:- start:178 stop:1785 length:1608 start_codon:yes stop_codon:yes gene_type:complete
MANGFNYESGLNRLLSVTIPNLVNSQLDRQERQRQFDESIEQREIERGFRLARADEQDERAERNFQANEQRYREQQQEKLESRVYQRQRELDSEIIENEIIEVEAVNDITNTTKAKEYLEKIQPTLESAKSKAIARRYMSRIDDFKSNPQSPLKILGDTFSDETISDLENLNSWKKPLTFSDINTFLTTTGSIDRLQNQQAYQKITLMGRELDKLRDFSKQLGDFERTIEGELVPSSQINSQKLRINTLYESTLSQYNKAIQSVTSQKGVSSLFQPQVGDEVGVDGVGGVVTVANASEAMNLSDGATFKLTGVPGSFTKNGDNFIPVGDIDFDSIVNPPASSASLSPGVVEDRIDSPEKTAIDRLASTGVIGRPDEESALSFLRRLPGAEREYGTGEGGSLSMGGSSKEQVVAVENLNRNTDIIIDSLKEARGSQVKQGVFEDSEQYQILKQENNNNLQGYIQNAYEAYLDERTSPQVRGRLKKYLKQMKALSTKPSIVARATLGRGENVRPIRFTGGESIFNQDTIELLSGIEL